MNASRELGYVRVVKEMDVRVYGDAPRRTSR
jgi:hypothetical protein